MPSLTRDVRSVPVQATVNRPPRDFNGHLRAWCVVHACNSAADVMQLIDGQQAAGMKPYLVAGDGSSLAPALVEKPSLAGQGRHGSSLLTAWNEVRDWRKLLLAPDVATFDLVHAHTFPAGMAAVRNCPAVVYDIRNFVESKAGGRAGNEFTWLARSFRVAEQFVITRAGAVVVHSHSMLQGTLDRGASRQNVFQVPEPLDAECTERLRDGQAVIDEIEDSAEAAVTLFAPDACFRSPENPAALPDEAIQLLDAFAILSGELANVRLIIQADAECVQPLFERATALGITERVHAVSDADRERALAETDVVIALSSEHAESTVLTGLIQHRAILAADVAAARDASAEGSGVLWFRPGDVRDLARRAGFLARNPDFRIALAQAGQRHLLETRTPEAVARRYDAIYRHAWERRRSGSSFSGMNLQPLTACF